MKHILLVEDDIALGQGIAMALQIPETEITVCRGLREARQALSGRTFILLILDINLPDGSGLTLLRERKALRPEVPVLLLTANDLEIDEVAGLESGADDYITKPFSLAVLRARVNARLRRGGTAKSGELSLPPFVFDFERMVYRKNGAAIELSRAEQRLLRALVENRGHAVSRAALVDRVWTDGGDYVDENALTVTVRRLRAKLEDDPAAPVYLKTVYGIGYIWAVTG
ncbi:MAG: response regulator transcription factor [Dysosmobacter sp.]|nr:response regulator transcription factor [Dysosmobacter sp.]